MMTLFASTNPQVLNFKDINGLAIEGGDETEYQRKTMHSNIQFLHSQPPWYLLLFLLGLVSIARFGLFFLKFIYTYFLRPRKNLLSYGKWAIVTGPTAGIGKSFAFELAKNGMNLILVGRNTGKLEQVKMEICAQYESIEVKVVSFDLSGDLVTGIESIREAVHELDAGVLVNNAGLGKPEFTYFHEADISAWMKMVRVNLEAVADITHAMLPLMLKRKKKSAIVNIGSGSASIPSYPLNAVYASTKAFVAQFSRSLYVEYKSKGIDVQCQVPLFVITNMTSGYLENKGASFTVPDPDTYVRAAVRCIGYDRMVIPHVGHFLQWSFLTLFPDFLLNNYVLSELLKQRSRMISRRQTERQDIGAGTNQ